MMACEVVAILALALVASALSFFSGFGLGTVLLPAFALVFPLEVAIAATAAVHLANSAWKAWLVRRNTNRPIVARFGIPAILGALIGASLLLWLPESTLWIYQFGGERHVTPLGLLIGSLIAAFAVFDLVPAFRDLGVNRRYLVPGGLVSGFFGGLSGHQGALRSVFLSKLGLDAKVFIATGAMCAVLVDVARLLVYGSSYARNAALVDSVGWIVIGAAILMAATGTILASRFVPKTTLTGLRILVGTCLLILGPALALGLV